MSKNKTKKQYRNREKIRQRSIYETKLSLDRHKAHSTNRRKQRAALEASRMRKSAYQAMKRYGIPMYPHMELIETFDEQIRQAALGSQEAPGRQAATSAEIAERAPETPGRPITASVQNFGEANFAEGSGAKAASKNDTVVADKQNNHNTHAFFGGLKAWLRKITRHE